MRTSLLMASIAALPLAACSMAVGQGHEGVAGTGNGSSRDFAVSGFTGVSLTGSDDVDVKIGSQFSVHAEGPSDVLDKLRIEKDGNVLKVGRQNTMGFQWSSGRGAHITVTMPTIDQASVTGSGTLTVDRVATADFRGSATGSGDLKLASVETQKARFDVTGSGSIDATGKAGQLDMSVTGSGDINATSLQAASASASVMGSGNINATVNGKASVSIMGSGDVDLGKNAQCSTTKMGSGDVRCGG